MDTPSENLPSLSSDGVYVSSGLFIGSVVGSMQKLIQNADESGRIDLMAMDAIRSAPMAAFEQPQRARDAYVVSCIALARVVDVAHNVAMKYGQQDAASEVIKALADIGLEAQQKAEQMVEDAPPQPS